MSQAYRIAVTNNAKRRTTGAFEHGQPCNHGIFRLLPRHGNKRPTVCMACGHRGIIVETHQ